MEELIACKKAVSKVVPGAPNVSSVFCLISLEYFVIFVRGAHDMFSFFVQCKGFRMDNADRFLVPGGHPFWL